MLGRFVLVPGPDTTVTLEQRVVAVAIADQVGAVLAEPNRQHPSINKGVLGAAAWCRGTQRKERAMADVVFVAVIFAFLPCAWLYVRGLDRLVRSAEDADQAGEATRDGADNVIALIVSLLVTAYLVAALSSRRSSDVCSLCSPATQAEPSEPEI